MTEHRPTPLQRTILLLQQLLLHHRQAALGCAQAAIETPETGAKLFFGSAFFDHAEAAQDVLIRLASLAEIQPPTASGPARFALSATTRPKLAAYRQQVLAKTETLMRALRDNLIAISDDPTERMLSRHRLSHQRLVEDVTVLQNAIPDAGLTTVAGILGDDGYLAPALPAREPVFDTHIKPVDLADSSLATRELAIELMHANLTDLELTTIEICCRFALENRDMPWDFTCDMARQTWDECRHARSFAKRILELGGRLGQRPTKYTHWEMTYGQPLAVALCSHQMIGEWTGIDGALWFASLFRARGDDTTADVFDFVARDECTHTAFGSKWLKVLAPSEAERARLTQQALDLRAAFGKPSDGPVAFPFHRWACEFAAFDLAEIERLQARFDTMGSLVDDKPQHARTGG